MSESKLEGRWSTGALRVASASLDDTDIVQLIGLRPTKSIRRGDPVTVSRPAGTRHAESVWILESGLSDEQPLERHIEALANVVNQHREGLERALSAGCYVDLVCAFSSGTGQGGFALEASLLRKLLAIPIGLVVDLFPPSQSIGSSEQTSH